LPPALTIFGAGLWAYLVLGELVVTFDFPESLAWLLLVAVFGLQCRTATAAGSYASTLRRAIPGVVAFCLCLFWLLFSASVLGTSGRSRVAAVTLLLWFFAVAMYSIGRVLARPRANEMAAPPWAPRFLRIVVWLVCSGTTALALLAALDAQ
jgi:K+ transporter